MISSQYRSSEHLASTDEVLAFHSRQIIGDLIYKDGMYKLRPYGICLTIDFPFLTDLRQKPLVNKDVCHQHCMCQYTCTLPHRMVALRTFLYFK